MAKASDNPYPSILLEDHADPTAPADGFKRLFVDTDEKLKMIDHASLVTEIGGGGITVKEEGSALATVADTLDFVGAGVVASGTGATKTITIAGASGATIVYPALKPATPEDDFDAALSGWTAVSVTGSFSMASVFAQAIDGSHLWLPFGQQHGYIYKDTTNVDQEWIVGGLISRSRMNDAFAGIAILDDDGDGIALIYHSGDNTGAILGVDAGVYTVSPAAQVFSGLSYGLLVGSSQPVWMRLTRVGNTWDAWMSVTGYSWEGHVAATVTKTITATRKCIGIFGNPGSAMNMVITADWADTVV
jgi:hypothetical protein